MNRGASAVPSLVQHYLHPLKLMHLTCHLFVEFLFPTSKALSNVLFYSAIRQQFCLIADMLGRGEWDRTPNTAGDSDGRAGTHTSAELEHAGPACRCLSGEASAQLIMLPLFPNEKQKHSFSSSILQGFFKFGLLQPVKNSICSLYPAVSL